MDQPTMTEINMRQVRASLSAMPYSGQLMSGRNPSDTDTLCAWLDGLAQILRRFSAQHDEQERQLTELRRQRAAVRAFLGTAED